MNGDRVCPTHETLASFLVGKLPPDHEEQINSHLEECAACEAQAQLLEQQTDAIISAIRQAPSAPVVADPGRTMADPHFASKVHQTVPLHPEGYGILRELGRGGMGVVYQAYQHRLKRLVAIKMILTGRLAGAEERVRFMLEGELLARLSHANFVQVYEVGTVEQSPGVVQPYLVLEYVDGGNLKGRMAEQLTSPEDAARQLLILARAMQAAHAQGIVHRDLKPANVLLTRDGTLKITDFGLAKELGTNASLTPTSITVGTPNYMAPEQARGGRAIGPAADVYALGTILYEMLVGRPPFEGESAMEVILQVLDKAPVPPGRLRPGVPRDLETICLKCLEKEPRSRYLQAGDLADDLECWLENRPIKARSAGRIERASKWARRHPLPAALLLLSVVSLVAGSAFSTYFGISATSRATEARQALEKAEDARIRAEAATEAERWERYLAEIAAASGSLQLHNVAAARHALEAAPENYRNWEWRHLHSQLDGARTVLRTPEAIPWEAYFSPDGKRLVTTAGDHTVRFWDTRTGRQTDALKRANGDIVNVRLSPDGTRLVTGGNILRLRDAATGALRWETPVDATVHCPTWSPNGHRLAGPTSDRRLFVWDAATGRELFAKDNLTGTRVVAFSPDSRRVAGNLSDLTIRVWDVTTGQESLVLRGAPSALTVLAYSPDGKRIAGGTFHPESAVLLWDAATGEQIPVRETHENKVTALAFSPDGRQLASGSMDQAVRLWDATTGAALYTWRDHRSFVNDLAFSPDGKHLVSASSDQTLRLWNVRNGRPVAVLRGHTGDVRTVQYSHDGTLIASTADDRTVRLWDAKLIARNGVLVGHTSFVYDVAFRPDGAQVASASWDPKVCLWDPTTGREPEVLIHGASVLTALTYSPDGRQLAVVARDEGVWLWDVASGEEIQRWHFVAGNWKDDTRAAFNPQGTLLAAGSLEGTVRLWNPATGEEVGTLSGHDGPSRDVTFGPDGTQLATAGADGTIRLWNAATRQQVAVLPGQSMTIYRLAYSPDGRLLAAGSGDKTVALVDTESQQMVHSLQLGSAVYGLSFRPDGTRLACACADNTIRLWDVAKRREVAELRGHDVYVHAVAFSRDGTRLVSGSGDRTVRVWDTLPAQERAIRSGGR